MSLISSTKLSINIGFDHPIDFATFPYHTFQTITISDPLITLSQFTITYQINSDRSYSIILEPIANPFYMSNVQFLA